MPSPPIAYFPGDKARGLDPGRPYPRICPVNSYGQSSPVQTTPGTFARYGMIITTQSATNPTTLRAANPNALILFYLDAIQVQVGSNSTGVPVNPNLTVWPGWWMTNVGTLATSAITNVAGSILVATPLVAWPSVPFPAQVTDKVNYEVVVVTNVASAGGIDTLTVTRNVWNSVGTAFAVGARVAALCQPSVYLTSWFTNVTAFCPRDGSNHRWSDYLALVTAGQIAAYPGYSGVFYDQCDIYLNPNVQYADSDQNNQIDAVGGDGPGTGPYVFNNVNQVVATEVAPARGTYYGILNLLRATKAACPPGTVILCNGSGYPGFSDGMFHENVTAAGGASSPTYFPMVHKFLNALYTSASDTERTAAVLINPCIFSGQATAVPGGNGTATAAYSYNYQIMRFWLALAALTGAWFEYQWCPLFHGQTWMFDEYYKAAGTALTAAVLTTDTALTVQSSAKFQVGDVLRVPHAVYASSYPNYLTNCEDETMTVTGIPDGTHLTVTRANAVKGTQIVGTAVFTAAQAAANVGWLGFPKGPAVSNLANLAPALAGVNLSFETSTPVAGTVSPVQSTFTGWSLSAATSGGNYPAKALFIADTSTFITGSQSLKVQSAVMTYQNSNGAFTYYNTKVQTSAPIALTNVNAGVPITLSFWAKGDRNQILELFMLDSTSAVICGQLFFLSSTWQQYFFSFSTPAANNTAIGIQFCLSGDVGQYWLDAIQLLNPASSVMGDAHIWTRDFQYGFVCVNGSNVSQNIALPAITGPYTSYKKLVGTQDTGTNNGTVYSGAGAATVTVPALDAIFLQKI